MLDTYQACRNCRFFKRTWSKVSKSMEVPVRVRYYDLSISERNLITTRVGNDTITEKGPYVHPCPVYWDEYVPQDSGVCRHYPPHPYHFSPTVDENHYCGEWRPILESRNVSAYPEE